MIEGIVLRVDIPERLSPKGEASRRARKRIDHPYPRVYRCRRKACEPERGCSHCEIYRCLGCHHLWHWSDGGTNSELCDACDEVVREAVRELFANGEQL